jgi:hypothetical protein
MTLQETSPSVVQSTDNSLSVYTSRHGQSALTGIVCEQLIVQYHGWKAASRMDNIVRDIDAYDEHGLTYSLKLGTANEKTNRLAFELEYTDALGNSYPSWYHTGKAVFYVFGFHNRLLFIHREKMHVFIDEHGWDCILSPHPETLAANQKNHVAKTCRNGIISLQRLMENDIITYIEVLNHDDEIIKQYHRQRYGITSGRDVKFTRSGLRFPTPSRREKVLNMRCEKPKLRKAG